MGIERLSEDAIQRVSGPSWQPLKQAFLDVSSLLLDVSPDVAGVLTTIYVKYQITSGPNSSIYAVVWLKNSKQIVIGLALPEDYESPVLGPAPSGMKYKGITKYFTIVPGDPVPVELADWATAAHTHVTSQINS